MLIRVSLYADQCVCILIRVSLYADQSEFVC